MNNEKRNNANIKGLLNESTARFKKPKIKVWCQMQENGFIEKYGRYLTLKECRKEFECNIDCKDCPCLIVQWNNRITRNYSSKIKEVE